MAAPPTAPYANCEDEGPEIFDIAAYSANDNVGYASIVGSDSNGAGQVNIGFTTTNNTGSYDTYYTAAIQVEAGQHAYLSNINAMTTYESGWDYYPYNSAAVNVAAGGSLTFGGDKSRCAYTGTVTLGSTNADR